MKEQSRLLTCRDVAQLLNVSVESIRKWAAVNQLASYTTPGGHRRFILETVREFARTHGMFLPETDRATGKEPTEPSSIKVLAVDDDPDFLRILSDQLPQHGIRVITAANGYEAGVLTSLEMPDLILLDFRMPYLDGFQVCRYLKGLPCFRHVPIFALTGLTSPRERERITSCGVDTYFAKPVNFTELIPAIRAAVARESFPAAQETGRCR